MTSKRVLFFALATALFVSFAGTSLAEKLTTVDGKDHDVLVVKVTSEGVTVKATAGEKLYKFDQLEAKCAYEFMKKTAGDDAAGHLLLGKYCLKRKLIAEAKAEMLKAKELDPALENEVNRIWAEASEAPMRPALDADKLKELLDKQRTYTETVEKVTGQKTWMLETPHYIIYTTFPPASHEGIKDVSEKLYNGLDKIFEVSKKNDRMWDGKCVLYFFKDRDGFVQYSTGVDHFPGQTVGGYFRAVGTECKVVIPDLHGEDLFKETMVHEGTHAFLHYYRTIGRLPRWVQEGTAQYFQFREFPKSLLLKQAASDLSKAMKSGKLVSPRELEEGDRPSSGKDTVGYAWSYAYVSFMVETDGHRYAEFIRGMKAGLEPEEALRKAFNWDYDALQKNWNKSHLRG